VRTSSSRYAFFLVQLVPECLDFLEGQGVRDGDRDLIGNEVQELQLGFLVGIRLLAREAERADPAPSGGQRKIAAALHSIRAARSAKPGQRVSRLTFEMISGRCVCRPSPMGGPRSE